MLYIYIYIYIYNNNNVLYCNKETIKIYAMTLCFQFKVTVRTPKEASGRLVYK